MPTVRNPLNGREIEVREASLPQWRRAGWEPVDPRPVDEAAPVGGAETPAGPVEAAEQEDPAGSRPRRHRRTQGSEES